MRLARLLAIVIAMAGTMMVTTASNPVPDPPPPPPGGPATVQTRNSKGQLSSTTDIPAGSAFRSYPSSAGGKPQPCYYDKIVTESTPEGGEVTRLEKTPGQWVFRMIDPAVAITIDVSEYWPALVDDTIRFQSYCKGDGILYYEELIDVSIRDPFFWDQATLDQLRADLQLAPIELSEPASVGRWGGLIVRSKVPLQVNGDAWRPQSSPIVDRHGVSLRVIVRPRVLAFRVVWEPNENATGGTPATSWNLTCANAWVKTEAEWFPPSALDSSGDTYEPGLIDGECAWSPPDSGEVTVFADITYDVFDVVNNVSQPTPPYVWTGQASWTTGQLRAVNVTTP